MLRRIFVVLLLCTYGSSFLDGRNSFVKSACGIPSPKNHALVRPHGHTGTGTGGEAPFYSKIKILPAIIAIALGLGMASSLPVAADSDMQMVRDLFRGPPAPMKPAGTPLDVITIMKGRFEEIRSGVTGEKITELRVGESLVARLRDIETELDAAERDTYSDNVDWQVLAVYPQIFRSYSPLFTAYTDRAFPSDNEIDSALRYALRYEVGGFYSAVSGTESCLTLLHFADVALNIGERLRGSHRQ